MSERIAVIKKIKRSLPLAEGNLYVNALVKPITLYRSCAWGTASEENVKGEPKLQKRAVRVILEADIGEKCEMLYRRHNWLPLKDELNKKKIKLKYLGASKMKTSAQGI